MYDNFISINRKFKSSVNLQYDLYNEEKIEQYVPTTDLCDVIKQYVKSVLFNENKATFLAGPYGKGKSYLMLMITYIFSKRENRKLFSNVLRKISCVDKELADLISEIDSKSITLLPVVINNNSFDDLNQNFMLALKSALYENGFENIIPKSTYNECLELLNSWESNVNSGFNILKECTKILKINLNELRKGLENYELKYFKKFEDLFSCVTHGCKFYPLISNDISEIYQDVTNQIIKQGYKGIFVIFDEFGVFLENQFGDFSKRLNKIQSFAEKCQSSNEYAQMHLCCITHKDINLYNKEKDFKDNFEKIAGRFKQLRFDRSLDENYQIICSAIAKKQGYNQMCKSIIERYSNVIDNLYQAGIFHSKEQIDYILNNGLPFNPLALYCLIRVSERVAQNERTLFTFLSDTDVNSFNYFISNNSDSFLNVSNIYDYFELLIKENNEYKDLYFKVESSKRMTMKKEDHLIIKTLAVIKLINDDMKFNSTIDNIALSLMMDYSNAKEIVNRLISKNILKQNINDNSIDFSVIPGSEINKLIDDMVATKATNMDLSELLGLFDKKKYFISNKYNFSYKMTRFYKSIYLEVSKFKKINNLGNLINFGEADGILINLINDEKITKSEIELILSNNDANIIVRYHKDNIAKNIVEKVRKLYGAELLLKSDKKMSEDLTNALPLYIEDLMEEINLYLSDYNDRSYCLNIYGSHFANLSECIYNSFVNFYSNTIILNNEQINKNNISSVTMKSRNMVMDAILKNKDMNIFGTTSAEATIYNSFKLAVEQNDEIVRFIKDWFIKSCDTKVNLFELIRILKNKPYGIRNGIIPLFMAYVISLLSNISGNKTETILLYNESSEIEVNGNNLSKIMDNPSKYYFYFRSISKSKIEVVEKLLKYFEIEVKDSLNDNIKLLVKTLKNKISNLPPIVIKSNGKDDILNLDKNDIKFKDLFLKHDLNNYDVIFDELPILFGKNFEDLYDSIVLSFDNFKMAMDQYHRSVIEKIKSLFGMESSSIKSTFDLWSTNYSYLDKIIFEPNENRAYKALKSIQYNDIDSINFISYKVMGCTLEDWNQLKQKTFFDSIRSMINRVNNYNETSTVVKNVEEVDVSKISNIGKTLYSNLSESLEEYGASLSNEEKMLILKKLMEDILG